MKIGRRITSWQIRPCGSEELSEIRALPSSSFRWYSRLYEECVGWTGGFFCI